MKYALTVSLVVLAWIISGHIVQVRNDCRVIYTLSEMIESREAMLGHQHQGKGPLLSAEITGRCKRYGVDFATGNR